MLIMEMLVRARLDDVERAAAHSARVREARRARITPAARRRDAPAARRLERVVTELYGGGQEVDADPALFSRLAWSGADGD